MFGNANNFYFFCIMSVIEVIYSKMCLFFEHRRILKEKEKREQENHDNLEKIANNIKQ